MKGSLTVTLGFSLDYGVRLLTWDQTPLFFSLIWNDEFMKSKDVWMTDSTNLGVNSNGVVLQSGAKTFLY